MLGARVRTSSLSHHAVGPRCGGRGVGHVSPSTTRSRPKATNETDAPMRIARSGRCLPSRAEPIRSEPSPTTIASASTATTPNVEPATVPNHPSVVASVIVAASSCRPARPRRTPRPRQELRSGSDGRRDSPHPRRARRPAWSRPANPKNATPATTLIVSVGSDAPSSPLTSTETACTTAVATVMPIRIGHGRPLPEGHTPASHGASRRQRRGSRDSHPRRRP